MTLRIFVLCSLLAPSAFAQSLDSAAAARGRRDYERYCVWCHGESGHGDGPALASLRDDQGNPIRAADFTLAGAFRCGDEPARVYTTFMTGLNGTPMPSFAQVITPAEAWDLVHFVRNLRR